MDRFSRSDRCPDPSFEGSLMDRFSRSDQCPDLALEGGEMDLSPVAAAGASTSRRRAG